MEDLVGAKETVLCVENRQFQGVDHTADCVDDTACEKPEKGTVRQGIPKCAKYSKADPAHGNVDDRGKPLGTGDPAGLDGYADQSNSPDNGEQCVAGFSTENNETDRGVGTGDQNKDHHVVKLTKDAQNAVSDGYTVVYGAGAVESNHAAHKDCHGDEGCVVILNSYFDQQRSGCQYR